MTPLSLPSKGSSEYESSTGSSIISYHYCSRLNLLLSGAVAGYQMSLTTSGLATQDRLTSVTHLNFVCLLFRPPFSPCSSTFVNIHHTSSKQPTPPSSPASTSPSYKRWLLLLLLFRPVRLPRRPITKTGPVPSRDAAASCARECLPIPETPQLAGLIWRLICSIWSPIPLKSWIVCGQAPTSRLAVI